MSLDGEAKGLISSEEHGAGVRSELSADTDAQPADIRSLALDPQEPQKPVSTTRSEQCWVLPSHSTGWRPPQCPHHLTPSDVAMGHGQEALSLAGVQRSGNVGSELCFAPGWLCRHEQASWLLGWVLL